MTGSKQRKKSCGRSLSKIMKNITHARQKHLSWIKKKCVSIVSLSLFCCSKVFQSQNDDSDDSESSSSSSDEDEFADELDCYLSSGHIKGVTDPIKWWHENQASYSRLSRMAKDFLMIPGKHFIFSL